MGAVHIDRMRNIVGDTGTFTKGTSNTFPTPPFTITDTGNSSANFGSAFGIGNIHIDISTVVPVGNSFAPRAWGALPCVYLGVPK